MYEISATHLPRYAASHAAKKFTHLSHSIVLTITVRDEFNSVMYVERNTANDSVRFFLMNFIYRMNICTEMNDSSVYSQKQFTFTLTFFYC